MTFSETLSDINTSTDAEFSHREPLAESSASIVTADISDWSSRRFERVGVNVLSEDTRVGVDVVVAAKLLSSCLFFFSGDESGLAPAKSDKAAITGVCVDMIESPKLNCDGTVPAADADASRRCRPP